MNKILTPLLAIAISSPAFAQTYQVAPAGYDAKEGEAHSELFGLCKNMRIQWAEGELGSTAATLKALGFRIDRSYLWNHFGRKHQSLTLYCSDTDHSAMSSTFSANASSTPTRTYSGSLALPAFSSTGPRPAPWSSSLNLPFATAYLHSGGKDLLIDATMTGGTLDNSANWSATQLIPYYLDTLAVSTNGVAGEQTYYGNGKIINAVGRTNAIGCADSKAKVQLGPYAHTHIYRYAPTHRSLPNRIRAYGFAEYVPPSTNILWVRGLAKPAGTVFPGVMCNKVYIDLSLLPIIRSRLSNASTATYTHAYDPLVGPSHVSTIPHNQAWVGIAFMTQAAFVDRGNGSLRVTQASSTVYPKLLRAAVKRRAVWRNNTTSTTGSLTKRTADFPLIRYTR